MTAGRRLIVLRVIAIVALAASGALVSDALRPERGFCLLEAACAKTRESALGRILGVPTSAIGAIAFGGLLVLTFLPSRLARRTLRLAGLLAAAAGTVFLGYQVVVLRTICPFCLVADLAGIAAGATVLRWVQPKAVRQKAKTKGKEKGNARRTVRLGEHPAVRLRWALAATVAFAAPFLWPHAPPRPSWVPRPEIAFADFEPPVTATSGLPPERPPAASYAQPVTPPAGGSPAPDAPPDPVGLPSPADPQIEPLQPGRTEPPAIPRPPPELPIASRVPEVAPTPPSSPPPRVPDAPISPPAPPSAAPPAAAPPPPAAVASTTREPVAVRSAPALPSAPAPSPPPPSAPPPAPAPPAAAVAMIEYLNPYCAHCRATHARLDRLLETTRVPVRRARVYVWVSGEPPLWARAIACAQARGVESALFAALLHAPDESEAAVWSAIARAGLDSKALAECIQRGEWSRRLEWERNRVLASRIEGLPTFDIGRRRLQGEQSEAELRDAIDAALHDLGLPRLR